ncbi:MAG: site-2 protease family protein [Candidatus Woesearchaeota archaeon]|nr:site-2 protease family protein [Candidatus Woesearchaeota archaeon]|tara:strand:+ start:3105 stop:4304 length:1200 start_codon:yes stop_codon:yes gene_type:complete
MSFVLAILEYKTAILFYSLVFLIVYINRKKFEVHGKLVYLYRTKIGISFMNFMAEKARRLVKLLGYFGIMIGFIGMIFTFILILSLTYKLLMNEPGAGGASPVIPGLPIAGTGLVFPLITGWIVLFIIILVHEFSHGVVASAYKIKIKNSGLAFFGPILGAFVEPNEKALAKQKDLVQHSVFAAGPFSNFLTVIVAMLIIWALLNPITNILSIPTGVIIYSQPGLPAEKAGIENGTVITGIYGGSVNTVEDFRKAMADIGPNKNIELKSDDNIYPVTTTESPDDPSQGYLGVWIMGEKSELRNDNFLNQILLKIINWFKQLLGWLAFLSLNIGLINLLPIFITDGARMLKIFFERIIPNKGKSMSLWLFFNWASLFSLLILVFLPLLRWLGSILDGVLI